MSLFVVERSPGLPFFGSVPRVRSTRTGQAAWPKVRSMRSSGVGLRRMRAAQRAAANADTPCAARVDPAATRRGTRPLTRLRPVQTAANPRTEPEAARRPCQTPDGIAHVRGGARPPRRTIGRRSVRRGFSAHRSRSHCGSAGSSCTRRSTVHTIAAHLRKTNRPCTTMVLTRRLRRSLARLCAGLRL